MGSESLGPSKASSATASRKLQLLAMAMPGSLYIWSIVVGICYAVPLAITLPTASELFGLKYYGLIYNILIFNLPFGSFLFSGLLAGILYDLEATTTAGGGDTCVGAHCYRLTKFDQKKLKSITLFEDD
ncbi:hypothetical protein GmHk_06G014756 [Glycine max]|nr:hypothetical protein GmHk_06G014756 [Glycine max]